MKIPVINGLLSRFRVKDATGPAPESADKELDGPQRWDDDLDLTLSSLISDQESKSLGTVQAITLSDFRETIGPLWEQHQDKVLVIAETTIDRMLAKAHTAIRQDDDTWMLVTPDLSENDAATFAKTIATAIGEKLVGARFEEDQETDPTPQTGIVDLTDALNEDGSINRDAIKNAVASAKAVIAARMGRERRERGREKEKPEPRHHMRTDKPSDKDQKASAGIIKAEDGLQVIYWPAWSADSQAIDTFICRAKATDRQNPFLRPNPLQNAANAIAVARTCAAALQEMINGNIRAKLVVPFPYAALMSPAQRQLLKNLLRIHESHRFLYLRPEIVDVPHSTSASELLTARDLLAPIGREVAIALDVFDPNQAILAAGKVMLGCDAGAGNETGLNTTIQALQKTQSAAGQRKTYAIGLPDRTTATKAIEMGFAEVGGIGLQPALQTRPTKTIPIPRDEFMRAEST